MKKLFVSAFLELKTLIFTYKKAFVFTLFLFAFGIGVVFLVPDRVKMNIFLSMADLMSSINTEKQKFFTEILINNLRVDFITLLLSPLIIPPFFMAIKSGIPDGIFIDLLLRTKNFWGYMRTEDLLAALLPHGIIEIVAMLLAQFLAILMAFKMVFKEKIAPELSRWKFFVKIFKIDLFSLVPLIVLAAFLEANVSLGLTNRLSKQKINQISLKNSFLDQLSVNSEDLKTLGIDSQEVSPTSVKDLPKLNYEMVAIYLYDKDISAMVREITPTKVGSKYFKANDSVISFLIREFKTNALQEQQKVPLASYKVLAEVDPSIKVTEIDREKFMVETDSKTSFVYVNYLNNFLYSVTFMGDDKEAFYKITQLQTDKIAKVIPAN